MGLLPNHIGPMAYSGYLKIYRQSKRQLFILKVFKYTLYYATIQSNQDAGGRVWLKTI